MSGLPKDSDGQELAALLVCLAPQRFVFGEPEVLEWLRNELLKRSSDGMPINPEGWTPIWK